MLECWPGLSLEEPGLEESLVNGNFEQPLDVSTYGSSLISESGIQGFIPFNMKLPKFLHKLYGMYGYRTGKAE